MIFNIFARERVHCFGQHNRLNNFVAGNLRRDKRPIFRQLLVDEFHSSAVFKCFDPLFVWHICFEPIRETGFTTVAQLILGPTHSVAARASVLLV